MSIAYDGIEFERIGHASVRIQTEGGQTVYIDPWSQALGTRAPHDADIVFVTHDDMDHYDPDAIESVSTDSTTVVVYEGVDTDDLERTAEALPYNGSLSVDGIDVKAIPAHNRSDGDHVDDDGNPFHAQKEVVGLMLTFDGTTVYYPSDTDFLDEHQDLTADVFLPPIGGTYTMDRHEAADFAESVDAELILPVHYDTFDEIETDAKAFKQAVETDNRTVELF